MKNFFVAVGVGLAILAPVVAVLLWVAGAIVRAVSRATFVWGLVGVGVLGFAALVGVAALNAIGYDWR